MSVTAPSLDASRSAGGPIPALSCRAVVMNAPGDLAVRTLALSTPGHDDVIVDVDWTGISTGTERLLYRGTMPPFPGLAYPLVPGYETVGRVVWSGDGATRRPGDVVYVPGARCFEDAAGLFGGAAARLVVPAVRTIPVPEALGPDAALLALAATAHHALAMAGRDDVLVVGHGTLGRLVSRLALLDGSWSGHGTPTVWEVAPARRPGASGYRVLAPEEDPRRDYAAIVDVSGDPGVLDGLVERLAPGGHIVLAGFYDTPLHFDFVPAFLREAGLRVAAQWSPDDLSAVAGLVADGILDLGGLVSHCAPAAEAASAYRQAFDDPDCLKMILDWRQP